MGEPNIQSACAKASTFAEASADKSADKTAESLTALSSHALHSFHSQLNPAVPSQVNALAL